MSDRKRKNLGVLAASSALAAGSHSGISIKRLKATAVREPGSRRTYVVVQVGTDSGLTGYGEAPALPDPQTAVARLQRLDALLRGKDPLGAVVVDQMLKEAEALAAARAAVNIALLDILGKASKAPLYETLGGPTRQKARAMAVLSGNTQEELAGEVRRAKADGYRAFSIPLKMPEGPTRGRHFYRSTRELLDSLREAAGGEDFDFVLDCAAQTTPGEGLSLAAVFEDFHLLWLDEPAADLNDQSMAAISEGSVTPVGYGRDITENGDFQDLLRLDAIDVLRPAITRSGITPIRKAAALAETYYLAVAPFHRGGPIATAAGLHIAASLPNFFIQEVPFPVDADRRMRDELAGAAIEKPEEGFFPLPTKPGLGIELNQDTLARHAVST